MSRLSRIPNVDDVPMDPAIAAELDALDAALRGDAIDDESLAALVRDVKAQAPVMPTELREGLREDVAAGFPRSGLAGRLRRSPHGARKADTGPTAKRPRRRSFAYGSGFAVTAVLAVFVVSIAANSGGDDSTSASSSSSEIERQIDAAPAGPDAGARDGSSSDFEGLSGVRDSSSESIPRADLPEGLAQAGAAAGAGATGSETTQKALEPSPGGATTASGKTSTPASGKRRVERSVDMTVKVKAGELSDAAGKVGDITRQAGGFVADSRVSAGTRGAGSATFTLQVASSKLDGAIGRLSDLGTVTSQDQASTDITSSFDSVQQRLGDAKAVRKALLRSLDKADAAGEIASLRSRIADNRGTIANLESDRLALERRTNLTTIALSLTAPSGDAPDASDDGSWSIGDAAGDAVDLLSTIAGVLLVAAAGLLPFAILAVIAWALLRTRRRHARDAALDA